MNTEAVCENIALFILSGLPQTSVLADATPIGHVGKVRFKAMRQLAGLSQQ